MSHYSAIFRQWVAPIPATNHSEGPLHRPTTIARSPVLQSQGLVIINYDAFAQDTPAPILNFDNKSQLSVGPIRTQ